MAAVLAGLLLPASGALAGGPLSVRDTGDPNVWSTMPISYRTDNGPLSAIVTEAQAQTRVAAMFGVWQSVPTSIIAYTRTGFISATTGFTDGDVSTAAEFNAVEMDCGNGVQSPIVYDADARIFRDLGLDQTLIIGFAGSCANNTVTPFQIVSGDAVMNGWFQDGQEGPPDCNPADCNPVDIPTDLFNAAMIHEFGHFSGLDHSQINVNCFAGPSCTSDDLEGLPTMFPILLELLDPLDVPQGTLSDDDKAWISRLYPAATFATTHGTITGTVFFSDGLSHAQFVNVIARRVDRMDTVLREDRRNAVSVSSGFRARVSRGNPINDPTGASSGSAAAGDIGYFEIPVPAGSYTIEVEDIHPDFTGGSGVGGGLRIAMPGTAPPPIGPIVVGAGATVSGNNITLIGSDPRFDQFEGP